MYKRSLLVSACLSVTPIYSIYSLQVKTMSYLGCGGFIHNNSILWCNITRSLFLGHMYRITTNLCIYISTHTISLIVLSTSSAGNTIIQATHVPYLEVMHGGYHPQPSLTNHGSMYPNHSITPYKISLGGDQRYESPSNS
jgi:hypothetical protein